MQTANRVFSWAMTALAVIALLAVVALVAMVATGMKPEVVKSGSMHPLFDRGYLIFVKPTPAASLKQGDVVTFQNPFKGPKDTVTHRIIKIENTSTGRVFTTKGDAVPQADPWSLRIDNNAGLYKYGVPYVGELSFLTHSRNGFIALFALPLLLLGFIVIRKIWSSQPPQHATAAG